MSRFTDAVRRVLPEGWSIYDEIYDTNCLLVCPCRHIIEQDGTCSEGCVSPLRERGLI